MEQGQMTHSKIKAFSSSMEESRRSRSDNRSIQGKRALEQICRMSLELCQFRGSIMWNQAVVASPLISPFRFYILSALSFAFMNFRAVRFLLFVEPKPHGPKVRRGCLCDPCASLCDRFYTNDYATLSGFATVNRRMDQSDLHLEDLPTRIKSWCCSDSYGFVDVCSITWCQWCQARSNSKSVKRLASRFWFGGCPGVDFYQCLKDFKSWRPHQLFQSTWWSREDYKVD